MPLVTGFPLLVGLDALARSADETPSDRVSPASASCSSPVFPAGSRSGTRRSQFRRWPAWPPASPFRGCAAPSLRRDLLGGRGPGARSAARGAAGFCQVSSAGNDLAGVCDRRYSLAPASRMGSIRLSRVRETPTHGNSRRNAAMFAMPRCAYGAIDQRDSCRTRTVPAFDRARYFSGRHLSRDVGAVAQGFTIRGICLREAFDPRREQPRPVSVDQRQDRRSDGAAAVVVAGRSRRAGDARVQGGRVFQAAPRAWRFGSECPRTRRPRSRRIRCRNCFAKRRAT